LDSAIGVDGNGKGFEAECTEEYEFITGGRFIEQVLERIQEITMQVMEYQRRNGREYQIVLTFAVLFCST
jgi:hypothetical protein